MLNIQTDIFPVLETERLKLRQMVISDAEAVFKLRTDDEVLKYLLRDKPNSMEEVIAFIERDHEAFRAGDSIWWAIELKESPGFIGNVGFRFTKKEHYRAETGYSIMSEHFGKRIVSEALPVILDYAFKIIGFHSIEANIDPQNQASKKLLLNNGFVKEAHFKEDYFYKGAFYDSAIYSLLNPYHKK